MLRRKGRNKSIKSGLEPRQETGEEGKADHHPDGKFKKKKGTGIKEKGGRKERLSREGSG